MAAADYLPRLIDGRIEAALQNFPIVIIDGPRAVGKTTSADRWAASTIRLPHDAALLAVDAANTLSKLEAPVLIDEWQLAGTNLLWDLKGIVDDDPTPGRFLLTGSVEPATYGPTYPLTGRAVNLLMRPMTAAELRGAGHEPTFLSRLADGDAPSSAVGAPTFSIDRLFATGFPAARDYPDPAPFLDGYAALVAQRAGDEGRDANRLLKTMAVLGVLASQSVPDQRIWESADINKASWKAYEDLLTRTHLSTPLPAYSSNRLKRLTTYPKRMLIDTALALALANLTAEDLRRDPALADRYVESYVAQQLRPQADLLRGTLSHLRSSGGQREIDLIIDIGDKRFAAEVKAGARPDAEDARHLQWLRQELGTGLDGAFVFHTGGETYPLVDGVWAVPISLL